jgi:hypothetical protein
MSNDERDYTSFLENVEEWKMMFFLRASSFVIRHFLYV